MHYGLPEHISYCLVDGHPIFLDLKKDRYFRLPSALESAFAAYSKGGEGASRDVRTLVEQGILTDLPERSNDLFPTSTETPCRSAIELPTPPAQATINAWLEVFYTVLLTQRLLATRSLKHVFDDTARHRLHHTARLNNNQTNEMQLLNFAASFRLARLYVPITPTCLLDSIALVRYLARRGHYANVTIGVNCNPFSAHAWGQAGDLVLNETVGEAIGHVPIKVI